jgi:hypothetical protein
MNPTQAAPRACAALGVTLALALAVPALASAPAATAPAATAPAATAKHAAGPSKSAAPVASSVAVVPSGAAGSAAAKSDSSTMTLKGGEEGTVFRTLTVEGEDRIHIEVERPELKLEMDPEHAPGLDWGSARDVLDRTTPDLEAPLRAVSATESSPWVARPWLAHFPVGAVARVRPAVKGVDHWKLTVVNARAEAVAVYEGSGDPPREIEWDGRPTSGAPVLPGASYSYVFEARDRAGNKRNFVGEGFRVSAFRYSTPGGPVMVFSGLELARPGGGTYGPSEPPPIVMEAATEVNQAPAASAVRIEVTAKRAEEGDALAARLAGWMAPYVIGGAARIRTATLVQADAPDGAAVRIATTK